LKGCPIGEEVATEKKNLDLWQAGSLLFMYDMPSSLFNWGELFPSRRELIIQNLALPASKNGKEKTNP